MAFSTEPHAVTGLRRILQHAVGTAVSPRLGALQPMPGQAEVVAVTGQQCGHRPQQRDHQEQQSAAPADRRETALLIHPRPVRADRQDVAGVLGDVQLHALLQRKAPALLPVHRDLYLQAVADEEALQPQRGIHWIGHLQPMQDALYATDPARPDLAQRRAELAHDTGQGRRNGQQHDQRQRIAQVGDGGRQQQ